MKRFSLLLLTVVCMFMAFGVSAANMAITLEGGSTTSFDRLEISDRLLFEAPADDRQSSSMTMSAWFRIPADYESTAQGTNRAFMGHRAQQFSNNNGSMLMTMSRTNIWAAESGANNGKQSPMRNAENETTTAPTGEWVFATMTYDSESHYWNFYQNGELICSFDNGKEWALFQDHSESPLYLSTIFFVGGVDIKIDLDEVQMFNRALSAEEVKTSMEAAQGMNGLVALYDFNDTPAVTGEYANVATGADAKTDIPAIVRQSTAKYNASPYWAYTVNSYSSREPATVEGREVAETPDPQPVGSIDTITRDNLAATDQNYADFSDLNAGSDARYAGQTAAGNEGCFNIRSSKNNSGIVTTQSGGRLKKVTITWGANASARTVRFYGKNTPYTAATDLFDSTKSGEVIGTLDYTKENDESVLILDQDVTYFGLRSISSAIYIKKVVVEWDNEPAPAMTEITLAEAENGTFRVLNGTEALTSGSTVAPGTELTLEATPAEGYVLVNFTVNGEPIEGNTYTVTEEPATIGAVFAEITYCSYPYTDKHNRTDRYTSTLKITGDAGEQTVDNLQSDTAPNELYIDRTDAVVKLAPGETFTLTAQGKGSWMHCYLWIDLDNDKVFTPNLDPSTNKVLDGSDLVSFSAYKGDGSSYRNPNGETVDSSQPWDAPLTYTLPADLPEGDYRARFIVDWNSIDPCGAQLNDGKTIATNGGIMADFTIRIVKPVVTTKKVTIATCDSELGTVAFVSPAVEGNECDAEGEVTVKATPASDKVVFVDWTDADYNVISTEAEFTFTPEADITLTANFAKLYTLTTSVIGEGSVRITSDEEGTDEIDLPATLEEETNVYAWFTPAENYELTSVMIGGIEYLGTRHLQALENGAYRAIVGMYKDTEIVATYTSTVQPVYYELTSKVNGEGSVRVTSDEEGTEEIQLPATLEEETMFYVWFIPAEGNKLSSALVGGIEYLGSHHLEELENGVYRALTGMFTNTEIEATFIVDEAFSIDSIDADSLTDAEVYTLTGVRVTGKPAPGLYIIVKDGKATKTLVK